MLARRIAVDCLDERPRDPVFDAQDRERAIGRLELGGAAQPGLDHQVSIDLPEVPVSGVLNVFHAVALAPAQGKLKLSTIARLELTRSMKERCRTRTPKRC